MKTKQLVLLLVFISFVAKAQLQNTVKGKVIDEKGAPAAFSTMQIIDLKKGISTNENGEFLFKRVGEGKHVIEVRKVGYNTITKDITVKKGENVIEITLVEDTRMLREIDIFGQTINNDETVTANRLDAKSIDMPGSFSTVSFDLAQQQQAIRIPEALHNIAGVYTYSQGIGGTSGTVGARGLSLSNLDFQFRDGLRFGLSSVIADYELQAYERVEVLKGGAAINFGYISPGATMNYVTKKPHLVKSGGSVSMRVGSYRFFKPSLDYNLKISDKMALRFLHSSEIAGSFRETVKSRRTYNSGSFFYKISDNTDLFAGVDFLYEKTPMDYGLPIFEDKIITEYKKVTRNGKEVDEPVYMQTSATPGSQRLYGATKNNRPRFLGSSFNNRDSHQLNSNMSLNHRLNDSWHLNVRSAISFSDFDYISTGTGWPVKIEKQEDGDLKIFRRVQRSTWRGESYGAVANLTGEVALPLSIRNKISVSIDYDYRNSIYYTYSRINDFDFIYLKKRTAIEKRQPNLDRYVRSLYNSRDAGFSFQNLLHIGNQINVLLSLRADQVNGSNEREYLMDKADVKYESSSYYGKFKKGDTKKTTYDSFGLTPSLGAVYKISPSNSLYVSYTNSYSPNTRGRLDVNDDVLPATRAYQYEMGTKNTFLQGRLVTNIAYYHIDGNSYLNAPGVPERYEVGPGTIYKGFELETAITPVRNLTVNMNYSYIDARYKVGKKHKGYRKLGSRPQNTPEHQIGFWSKYKFTEGALRNFSVNFGGEYTGERLGNYYSSREGAIPPYIHQAFTLLNAGAGWEKDKLGLRFKITNLTNEFVFFSHGSNSVNPIAPRQFAFTATYKFGRKTSR